MLGNGSTEMKNKPPTTLGPYLKHPEVPAIGKKIKLTIKRMSMTVNIGHACMPPTCKELVVHELWIPLKQIQCVP